MSLGSERVFDIDEATDADVTSSEKRMSRGVEPAPPPPRPVFKSADGAKPAPPAPPLAAKSERTDIPADQTSTANSVQPTDGEGKPDPDATKGD